MAVSSHRGPIKWQCGRGQRADGCGLGRRPRAATSHQSGTPAVVNSPPVYVTPPCAATDLHRHDSEVAPRSRNAGGEPPRWLADFPVCIDGPFTGRELELNLSYTARSEVLAVAQGHSPIPLPKASQALSQLNQNQSISFSGSFASLSHISSEQLCRAKMPAAVARTNQVCSRPTFSAPAQKALADRSREGNVTRCGGFTVEGPRRRPRTSPPPHLAVAVAVGPLAPRSPRRRPPTLAVVDPDPRRRRPRPHRRRRRRRALGVSEGKVVPKKVVAYIVKPSPPTPS